MTEFVVDSSLENPKDVLEVLNNLDRDLDNVADRIERLYDQDVTVDLQVQNKPLKNETDGEIIQATIKDK